MLALLWTTLVYDPPWPTGSERAVGWPRWGLWAVHGMGGLWGVIATGIFATASVNNYIGLIYGTFISLQCR